jgi:hypothetical protein
MQRFIFTEQDSITAAPHPFDSSPSFSSEQHTHTGRRPQDSFPPHYDYQHHNQVVWQPQGYYSGGAGQQSSSSQAANASPSFSLWQPAQVHRPDSAGANHQLGQPRITSPGDPLSPFSPAQSSSTLPPPQGPQWAAQTAALSTSGPSQYVTHSGDQRESVGYGFPEPASSEAEVQVSTAEWMETQGMGEPPGARIGFEGVGTVSFGSPELPSSPTLHSQRANPTEADIIPSAVGAKAVKGAEELAVVPLLTNLADHLRASAARIEVEAREGRTGTAARRNEAGEKETGGGDGTSPISCEGRMAILVRTYALGRYTYHLFMAMFSVAQASLAWQTAAG